MQPNTPSPAPPPAPMPTGSQGQYDFIMNNGGQKQKFSFASNKKQVIFLAGVLLFVLVLFLIIGSVITNSGKSTTQTLINLAEEQTELVRVAGIGTKKARGSTAKSYATATMLAVQTSQQDTVALLKKQGHKLSAKQLALKKDSKTDDTLNAAALNNTFDDAFLQLMQASLKTYQTDVKQAYDASKNKNEKALLATSYNGINTILAQSVTASDQPN